MGHENYLRHDAEQGSSNRAFGIVFAAVFTLVGLFPALRSQPIRLWALVVAAGFIVLSLALPRALGPLNRLWTQIGLFLHRVTSPVVLGVMFFLVITPMGLLRRALGGDPLALRFEREAKTYWVPRQPCEPTPESMKNQF